MIYWTEYTFPIRRHCCNFPDYQEKPEFVQKCVTASRGGLRTKLLGLQSRYREKSALILVQANGLTRQLWHGLTDKKIAEYQMNAPYMPPEIEIGKKDSSYMRSFLNTGIRIMRIRENQSTHEVPDYFTDLNQDGNCISASGIYQYQSVFWGLESRPYNKEYTNSYRKSKIDAPSKNFDECSLIEYYPMQLQSGDDAEHWVAYFNYLREVLPETKRSVRLSAPLHFAELMKEYLLLKK